MILSNILKVSQPLYKEMAKSILDILENSGTQVIRMNVSFGNSTSSGFDYWIGKAAHVNFLNDYSFLRMFSFIIKDYIAPKKI